MRLFEPKGIPPKQLQEKRIVAQHVRKNHRKAKPVKKVTG
jgi:hypothetical protein